MYVCAFDIEYPSHLFNNLITIYLCVKQCVFNCCIHMVFNSFLTKTASLKLKVIMPSDWMITGIFFLSCPSNCLFVCLLSILIFIMGFWTVRDTDLIFGMKTPLMMPFQMTSEGQCSCDLDFDRYAQNNYFGPCRQARHRVLQTHLVAAVFVLMLI